MIGCLSTNQDLINFTLAYKTCVYVLLVLRAHNFSMDVLMANSSNQNFSAGASLVKTGQMGRCPGNNINLAAHNYKTSKCV